MDWDHLVISGDLTQLGLEQEFEEARRELEPCSRKKTGSPSFPETMTVMFQIPKERILSSIFSRIFWGTRDSPSGPALRMETDWLGQLSPGPLVQCFRDGQQTTLEQSETLIKESDPQTPSFWSTITRSVFQIPGTPIPTMN